MNEEFEFGELVDVRDNDQGAWLKRHYVGTLHQVPPHPPLHYVMRVEKTPKTYDGVPGYPCKQIRKAQPEHDLIEIEQPESIEHRLDRFEAVLNGAIAHMNAQINSIKSQLK